MLYISRLFQKYALNNIIPLYNIQNLDITIVISKKREFYNIIAVYHNLSIIDPKKCNNK